MKKIKFCHVIVAMLFVAFVFSLVSYLVGGKQRRTFTFPVIGLEKPAVEIRYLPRKPVQGDVSMYVDELLLGPSTPRARRLFSAGTKNEFCFLRDKTLYVGLSKEVLYEIPEAASIKDGIAYFKKNIRQNFRSVKSVELFVDGKYVE